MKCKLNFDRIGGDPSREDFGKIQPAGTIIEHKDAFYLCGVHHHFERKLTATEVEVIWYDGNGHPVRWCADPADQECLDACIKAGWRKDFKLPEASPPPVLTTDV